MLKTFIFFVTFIIASSFASNELQHGNGQGMFYYDIKTGQPLCGEAVPKERVPAEKIIFRRVPCSCENLSCGCCAGINLSAFNFNRKACTKFTYEPFNFAIKTEITMNNRTIVSHTFSAKNPPPLCIPMPYLPFVDFCVRFYDIFTPGHNLHACIDFETRIAHSPILVLHFDCIRIGADGIAWLKPEDNGGLNRPQVTIADHTIYDDVAFEVDNTYSTPCSNITHSLNQNEEEDTVMIGQLKE